MADNTIIQGSIRMIPKRCCSAWTSESFFRESVRKDPKSAGDYGAWDDCLQYTSVTGLVGY